MINIQIIILIYEIIYFVIINLVLKKDLYTSNFLAGFADIVYDSINANHKFIAIYQDQDTQNSHNSMAKCCLCSLVNFHLS